MSGSLASAFLTLVPKVDTDALVKEGESAGEAYGNSFQGKLSGAAKGAGIAFGVAVAGAGLAAGAFKEAVTATAEYGDNVDKMSQRIGISSQSYQQWAYVMERAGTSIDVMQSGMKTLSSQAYQNSEAFQALGISEEEVANLSKEDLFGRVIEGLSGMEDGTERSALATQLLGRAGSELGPLLNEGTDAISEQMQMALDYGMVMDDESVKAAAAFQDSMATLQGAMTGAKNAMMTNFLPGVTKVADGLAKIITGSVDEGVKDIAEGVKSIVGKIGEALPKFLEAGGNMVGEMLNGLNENMPNIVSGMVELLQGLVSKIIEWAPLLLSAAGQLFIGLVQAIPPVLANVMSGLADLLGQAVGSVLNSVGGMFSAGADFIGGVARGVLSIGSGIADSVWQLVSEAPGKVSEFVGQMITAGSDLVQGLIDGITSFPGRVGEALMGIAGGAVDSFKEFFGIASPSKLMRRFGGYIGEGLEEGIADSERGVDRAMQGLMNTAYGATADYGIGISATANGSSLRNSAPGYHGITINNLVVNADDVMTERKFERMIRGAAMAY